MAYIEFYEQIARNESLSLNGTFYKNNVIYVGKQNKSIPITFGKKEKWYNINMDNFFEGDKIILGLSEFAKKWEKRGILIKRQFIKLKVQMYFIN